MNILYENFPDFVRIRGRNHRIVTDYREWIKFLELALDSSVPVLAKARLMSQWYLEEPEKIDGDALDALFEFAGAEELYPSMGRPLPALEERGKPLAFSFSVDACCIYCAFMESYGIDLQEAKMHWWKFRALFDGLPEGTEIKQRIAYRTTDVSKVKDNEERKRIKDIQNRICLDYKRKLDDFDIGGAFL